jgi:GTPase
MQLFRHKHEIESGRTSSVGNDILGFDATGNVCNDPNPHDGRLDWSSLCAKAAKVALDHF